MNNTNQIRQLLQNIINEIGCVDPNPTEQRCQNHAQEALALLPCETCNGTGTKEVSRQDGWGRGYKVKRPCQTCEGLGRIVVPRKIIPGVDWEPCPNCQPCKTCNGTGQVDDPQAGNSHMLTLMPCPDCT